MGVLVVRSTWLEPKCPQPLRRKEEGRQGNREEQREDTAEARREEAQRAGRRGERRQGKGGDNKEKKIGVMLGEVLKTEHPPLGHTARSVTAH